MLGNDVVDLLDVDARPETFHRRFDVRVFTEDERRAIADDPHPHSLRWALWAAKEAAYKCLRQADPRFVFSPIGLEASFEPAPADSDGTGFRRGALRVGSRASSAQPGAAWSDLGELELRAWETRDHVHVVARPAAADWSSVSVAVAPLADRGEEPSLAVRRLARRELARVLAVEEARIAIGRRGRIPTFELDGAGLPFALSLSHHGRFVACALAPWRAARDGDGASATKRVRKAGSMGNPAGGRDAKRRTG